MKERSHLDKIFILRGIGILRVFFYHAQLCLYPGFEVKDYNNHKLLNILNSKSALLNLFPIIYGWTGIEILILISGFAIHWSFLSANQTINFRTFYSKRFWRLYPAYLLVIFIFCYFGNGLHYYLFTKIGLKDLLSHLFLVHNLFNEYYFSINPSLWTLALEMQFYLIYPLFLFMRKKVGIKKAFYLSFVLSPISHYLAISIPGGGTSLAQHLVFNGWFVWCAGAFLAEKYYRRERVFTKWVGPIIFLGFTATILSKLHLYTLTYTTILGTFTWFVIMEWFLYTRSVNIKSYIFKMFSAIGVCSYSIYLIHQPYLSSILSWFNFLPVNSYFSFIKTLPAFAVIFLIAYFMYKYIEVPFIKLGSIVRKRKKTFVHPVLQEA